MLKQWVVLVPLCLLCVILAGGDYMPQRHLASRPLYQRREGKGDPFCVWGEKLVSQRVEKGDWESAAEVRPRHCFFDWKTDSIFVRYS